MSRSGYSDSLDQWELIRYRGQVASAIRGKRGQALLRDLLVALDAMPAHRLIAHELRSATGEVCAIGSVFAARNIPPESVDETEPEDVAHAVGIAPCLAAEIAFENDEAVPYNETPEHRWERMRAWVAAQLKATA